MAEETSPFDPLLHMKFKPFNIEKSVYLSTKSKGNNPLLYAKYICDSLKEGDVPDELMQLYREAVYGTDQKVKDRIFKHMYFLATKVK